MTAHLLGREYGCLPHEVLGLTSDDMVDTHAINVAAFTAFHESQRGGGTGGRSWVVYSAAGVN